MPNDPRLERALEEFFESERLASNNGAALQCGVRPEKITLLPADGVAPDRAVNRLRGQVTLASFLGVSIQYLVRTQGGEELTVFEQNTQGGGSLGPGRDVLLCWEPEHTFVVAKEAEHE